MRVLGVFLIAIGLVAAAGCSSAGCNRLHLSSPVTLRVAVLPFQKPEVEEPFFAPWIDEIPIVGKSDSERPEEILRGELNNKLRLLLFVQVKLLLFLPEKK